MANAQKVGCYFPGVERFGEGLYEVFVERRSGSQAGVNSTQRDSNTSLDPQLLWRTQGYIG